MKVYVILVDDRHCDPSVWVLADKDRALRFAEAMATEHSPEPVRDRLNANLQRMGWIYYVEYSCDGDSVTVMEKDLKE